MSVLADRDRRTLNRVPGLGTIWRCRERGFGLFSYLIDKRPQIFHRIELDSLAAVDLVQTLLDSSAQPLDLGFIFRFALLQEAQGFAYHFAGIAEAA